MFCPKCGSLLPLKNVGKKKVLGCSCGYTEKGKKDYSIKDSVKKAKEIEVVEEDAQTKTLPKIEIRCPKCNNNEAYFWLIQTRAGDEPETKFHRCTKCKHTWRNYD